MMKAMTIGLDIAKLVFHVHGADNPLLVGKSAVICTRFRQSFLRSSMKRTRPTFRSSTRKRKQIWHTHSGPSDG
jgi:hypothetical protein